MRLLIKQLDLTVELSDMIPTVLVIEDSCVFSEVCCDIWKQYNGDVGRIILSNEETELKISKNAEVIFNPFSINFNDKKILSRIYKELDDISKEVYYEEKCTLLSGLVSYLDKLSYEVQYPLTYTDELNNEGLFKLFGVMIDDDSTGTLDRICNYMKLLNRISRINVMITIGLKSYLSPKEFNDLSLMLSLEKVYLLDMENSYNCKYANEQTIIIDESKCIINLN